MKLLIKILAGAIPGIVLIFSSILFFCWRCRRRRPQETQQLISHINKGVQVASPGQDSFQAAVAKFHNKSNGSRSSLRFHHLRPIHNQNLHDHQPFSWDANPRLISDVVENGWSRFVFADRSSVPRSSPLWSLCVACDASQDQSPQIDWEVQPGTTEFMQTAKISPARAKKTGSSGASSNSSSPLHVVDNFATCCTRMSLPLPGPTLIGSSFPQEAYFEIKILHLQPPNRGLHGRKPSKDGHVSDSDDDRLKLIEENHCKLQSDALVNAVHDAEIELKCSTSREAKSVAGVGKANNFLICLGLTTGDSNQTKSIPGTYPGSIGFQSNGSVYLDGITLVSESKRTEWAAVDRVIGCGYSPTKKKVFFTVDTTLVHVIRCNSEVYRSPLYPVLAANSDVMVSVNLGQAAFKYAPANTQRTTNPSFLRSSPSFSCNSIRGYEDSNELFSMGMEDSERSYYDGNTKSPSIANSKSSSKSSERSKDYWDDASLAAELEKESDLFEIALN